jgi:predicted PurR-regulated permease PerM
MKESERSPRGAGGEAADVPEPAKPAALVGALAAAAVFVYLLRNVLLPFVLAGIVAYVLTPLITWLGKKTSLPRWLFAVLAWLALLGIAAVVGYLAAPPLFHELLAVGGNLRGAVESLLKKVMGEGSVKLFGETVSASSIAGYAVNAAQSWFRGSGVLVLGSLSVAGFFGFILTWVLLGYLLVDGPRVGQGLLWTVPPAHRPAAARIWRALDPIMRRYFVGIALVVLYGSAAAYLGLGFFLKLRHALVLALLTGLFEVIPLIGPALSAIIAGLAAVQEAKSGWNILTYVFYAIALRISIDQFVGPLVLGKAASVRPVLVIFCFLAGAALFGIIGMVLAVPVALTTKVILGHVYEDRPA